MVDDGRFLSAELGGRLAPVRDRIARFVRDGEVVGAALAVAVGGELVGEAYFGDASPDRPASDETLWPLASISKLYTAAAVMALVERGELSLATPVRSVLPEFDDGGRELVTLRHLLTHTSGLIYESPEMEALMLRQTALDELVDEIYDHPLQFTPGARFSYSDYGFALAARVVEAVAGRAFPEVLQALVLEPAGLHDTYLPPPPAAYARVAHVVGSLAYGTDSAMYNSPYALALAHPAFGAVASVRDLLRFGLLFAPGARRSLLSGATVRAMTTDQLSEAIIGSVIGLDPEGPRAWGLGFAVRGNYGMLGFGDLSAPTSFGHPGASGCTLLIDPVHDVALAYVSNRHVRADGQRFVFRLDAVVNTTLAALTSPANLV
jgi:CubicO group peptidase (beta-lactamase class C family)